ncbi:MAG: CHASE4 domain-containing protein [Thermodesulfobacteriota bacterium]
MSTRLRIFLILLLTFIVYALLALTTQRFIFFPKFDELEKYEVLKDIQRAQAALEREKFHLESLTFDWGYWDDTYHFIKDRNRQYIKSNLNLTIFADIKVNLVYFVDLAGRVVWGKAYDLETGKLIELQGFPENMPGGHFSLLSETADTPRSGIFITEKGPMLVTATPIRQSSGKGPTRGSVVMGRFLTDNSLAALAKQIQVPIRISPIKDGLSSTEEQNIISGIVAGNLQQPFVQEVNEDINRGYAVLYDIFKNPVLLMKADINRSISKQGRKAVLAGTVLLALIGVLVCLTLYFVLKVVITTPLVKLADHMATINKDKPILTFDENITRSDEIGILTRQFNFLAREVNGKIGDQNRLISDLQTALKEIKTLKGIIPICAACKKIRNDSGYWQQIESYIQSHSEADFSHGICPACSKKLYPDIDMDC